MKIFLASPYEVDYQPLGVANVQAYIKDACIDAELDLYDLSVQAFDYSLSSIYDIALISISVFASVEEGIRAAKSMRQNGFSGPIIFYNQYVTVHPVSYFLDTNCFVILGEYEEAICEALTLFKDKLSFLSVSGVWNGGGEQPAKRLTKTKFLAPDRSGLPDLKRYAKTKDGLVVGNVEVARGCAHKCGYCSVYAAYEQKVVQAPVEVVLEDIAWCVAAGAQHITFIDADWFSNGKKGLQVLEAFHERFPGLTCDLTARADDLVKKQFLLPDFRKYGCVEITTALEFPKEEVFQHLTKRMTLNHATEAIRLLREAGIAIKPTFINFTPYISHSDLALFDKFVEENQLEEYLDPLQKETRLLLYKGSPLLETEFCQKLELIEHEFHYDWVHPDSKVDDYYNEIATPNADGKRKKCCIKG